MSVPTLSVAPYDFFPDDRLETGVRRAGRLGADGIEFALTPSIKPERLGNLVASEGLAISAVADPWAIDPDPTNALTSAPLECAVDHAEETLESATALGAEAILVTSGSMTEDVDSRGRLIENLSHISQMAAKQDVAMFLEPTNPVDDPDAFPTTWNRAVETAETVDESNLSLVFDTYHRYAEHAARPRGDEPPTDAVASDLRTDADAVGAIHVADHPARRQPGAGDIVFETVFTSIDDIDVICCECAPTTSPHDAFDSVRRSVRDALLEQ